MGAVTVPKMYPMPEAAALLQVSEDYLRAPVTGSHIRGSEARRTLADDRGTDRGCGRNFFDYGPSCGAALPIGVGEEFAVSPRYPTKVRSRRKPSGSQKFLWLSHLPRRGCRGRTSPHDSTCRRRLSRADRAVGVAV